MWETRRVEPIPPTQRDSTGREKVESRPDPPVTPLDYQLRAHPDTNPFLSPYATAMTQQAILIRGLKPAGRRSMDCQVSRRRNRRSFLRDLNCMKLDCRIVLVFALAALVLTLAPSSESATGPRKSKSELAYYQDNPYQYLYGNVVNIRMFRRGDQQFTNVEVKPVQTYPMFSQYVTFCDSQEDKLDLTTSEPVVLVYSRVMHRRDCYDLLRVDIVQKARRAGLSSY
jgi:hypothetical protein